MTSPAPKLSTHGQEEAASKRSLWLQTAHKTCWGPFDLGERVIRGIYEHILRPGDTVIDGGANHGIHSFPLSEKVGETGRVISIEANPFLAKKVESFVKQHDLRNIEVVIKALGAKDAYTFFYITECDGWSGIRKRPDLPSQEVMTPLIRLDTIAREKDLSNVRFIKLDLEGGEYHTLCGARNIMHADNGPMIILENGRQGAADFYGYTKEDWFHIFEEAGYKTFDLFGRPITPDAWNDPDIYWYSIAAKTAEDIDFVEFDLQTVIQGVHDNLPPEGELSWPTKKFEYAVA